MAPGPEVMLGEDSGLVATALRQAIGDRYVVTDDERTRRYTVDWTGRSGPNRAIVARPADVHEVAAVLMVAASHQIPVVPQGGNTGLVAGSVPPERGWVVLSTERLTSIGEFDERSGQITAGAGVTLATLEAELAGSGWRFAVDLGARESATVGGIIATNAGGLGVFRYGSTRAQLLGVEAALSTGAVIDQRRLVDKDNTGYDLSGLLCGSEGTLAVVTSARLRLIPNPPHRLTALIGYEHLAVAFDAAWLLRRQLPAADVIELIGPGCLELVAAHDGVTVPSPASTSRGTECALLVEIGGDDLDDLALSLATALGATAATWDAIADSVAGRKRLARFREGLTEVLGGVDPLKLDVSIPADSMTRFCIETAELVHSAGAAASVFTFGHVCDHNLHLNIVGLRNDSEREDIESRLLRRVVELHGSVSAEHGIGRRRRAPTCVGADAGGTFVVRRDKSAWDPSGILNPGILGVGMLDG